MFIAIKIKKKLVLLIISIVLVFISTVIFKETLREYLKISYKKFYLENPSYEEIINLEKDLNVNKIDYNWTEDLIFNNKPEKIIFHHAARSIWDPEGINEFHKSKGWKGIGYNYYIRKDGSIYLGRDENAEGAHTKGENSSSIGICLEGNFEEEEITKEQFESIEKLTHYLILKYDIYKIMGHRDVYETLCPGENCPLEYIKEKVLINFSNSARITSIIAN